MTRANLEAISLQWVFCIQYLVQFQGHKIQTLIDSKSEVNAMTPTFVAKLGLITWKTVVSAQKIDGSSLVTYKIVLVGFSIQNKLGKVWFFNKTFLLADTSMEVVLEMFFLTFSNANM